MKKQIQKRARREAREILEQIGRDPSAAREHARGRRAELEELREEVAELRAAVAALANLLEGRA